MVRQPGMEIPRVFSSSGLSVFEQLTLLLTIRRYRSPNTDEMGSLARVVFIECLSQGWLFREFNPQFRGDNCDRDRSAVASCSLQDHVRLRGSLDHPELNG